MNDTLNIFDNSETRTPTLIVKTTVLENHPQDSRIKIKENGIFQTMGVRGGQEYDPHTLLVMEERMETKEPVLLESNQNHATITTNGIAPAIPAAMGMGGGYIPMITEEHMEETTAAVDCRNATENGNTNGTLQSKPGGGTSLNLNNIVRKSAVVRRLTPKECERLQGYPDGWTDIGEWTDSKGKKHKDSDSPRYKALGNSIALPFWRWMAERMVAQLDTEEPTMASLFDGIGGFPLVFSECGCRPVWASEIEEFPIAVTKIHFPEE